MSTGAGDVNLRVPKLRRQTFETAIIERYRRRERSGMTAPQGQAGLRELLAIIAGSADKRLPTDAHARLVVLAAELEGNADARP